MAQDKGFRDNMWIQIQFSVVASWIRNGISGWNFVISSAGARFIIKDCNVGSVCVTV